jgi:hypothetical protein
MADLDSLRQSFIEQGVAGPIPLLDPGECTRTLASLIEGPGPAVWAKGRCLNHPSFYQLATRPDVLHWVTSLLGEDVLLWGARLVRKKPGDEHPWHSDMECCGDGGRSITCWMPLEGADRRSSLNVISGSHRFGVSLQEEAFARGKVRSDVAAEEALDWAQRRDPRSRLHTVDARDGEALLFDGRLWHHSNNTSPRERTAVLLQYCTPDMPIRMPESKHYEYPFRFSQERTPCLLVSGQDRHGINLRAPAPAIRKPAVRVLDTVEFKPKAEGWTSGRVFRRSTPVLRKLWSHVSILQEGAIPHDPHRHEDEELLIVLDGAVEILREDDGGANRTCERLAPGQFAYHAAYQGHTLRGAGPGPARYLIFKWIGEPRTADDDVMTSRAYSIRTGAMKQLHGWTRIRVCDSPTRYLK